MHPFYVSPERRFIRKRFCTMIAFLRPLILGQMKVDVSLKSNTGGKGFVALWAGVGLPVVLLLDLVLLEVPIGIGAVPTVGALEGVGVQMELHVIQNVQQTHSLLVAALDTGSSGLVHASHVRLQAKVVIIVSLAGGALENVHGQE